MSATEAPAAAPRFTQAAGVRRVLANALSLLLAYALPRLAIIGSIVVAARVLGADAFGAYSTAAAFAVVVSVLATLGMTPLLIRDIARAPEHALALLGAAHRVKTGTNAAMLVVLLVVARWVLDYPAPVVAAAALLGIAYAIGAYVENLSAYFQAVERMHVWTQASAVYGLVTGVAGLALVWATASLTWFCVAPVAGQLAALGWLLKRLPAPLRRPATVGAGECRRLMRALAPFAIAFITLTIYYKVDVLLLARWRPAADVGIYAAAYKFVDIVQALAIVAVGAVYPRLSRAARAAGTGGWWVGAGVTELMLLAAVPVAGVLWLLRAPLLGWLYGDAYAAAAPVLGLLAPALPALAVNILAGYVLGAMEKMTLVAGAYAGALAVNVALNTLWVPVYGARGSAGAMLVSELVLGVVLLGLLHWRAAAAPRLRTAATVVGACAVCGAVGALIAPDVGAALIFLAAVALLYAGSGVIPASERAVWRQALRPPRPVRAAEPG
ncbi:MAG TPA: oligosaccharide flippase family protein [Longimicrobiales bacterium]